MKNINRRNLLKGAFATSLIGALVYDGFLKPANSNPLEYTGPNGANWAVFHPERLTPSLSYVDTYRSVEKNEKKMRVFFDTIYGMKHPWFKWYVEYADEVYCRCNHPDGRSVYALFKTMRQQPLNTKRADLFLRRGWA